MSMKEYPAKLTTGYYRVREDWEDEANWYKVNPSLGCTVDIERLRDAYREAK